LLSKSLSR